MGNMLPYGLGKILEYNFPSYNIQHKRLLKDISVAKVLMPAFPKVCGMLEAFVL